MDALHKLFFFIVAVSILIAFHEFGHFWVARRVGVRVLRFSVGFGQVLWRRQKHPDATEFVICALPLGGYVKMLDEREAPVAEADLPYAFNRQSLWKRTAIVVAGPLANLLLAVVLLWGVLVTGEEGMRPIVGTVDAGTLAEQAGFHEGDEIVAVDGKSTPTWMMALNEIFGNALDASDGMQIQVKVGRQTLKTLTLRIPEDVGRDPKVLYTRLGLIPWVPKFPPIVGKLLENKPAAKAGLQHGDLIVSADGKAMPEWTDWVGYVQKHAGTTIHVEIERAGKRFTVQITPEDEDGVGKVGMGVDDPENLMKTLLAEYRLPPMQALTEAVNRTAWYSWSTLKMLGYMLVGKASVDNLSGPISIAKFAGESASMGLVHFVNFLAAISVSLGVLNLLPIPVLDGGLLLFYGVEAIKGGPVSEQAQAWFQQVGIAILLSLMILAFYLDLGRVFS